MSTNKSRDENLIINGTQMHEQKVAVLVPKKLFFFLIKRSVLFKMMLYSLISELSFHFEKSELRMHVLHALCMHAAVLAWVRKPAGENKKVCLREFSTLS